MGRTNNNNRRRGKNKSKKQQVDINRDPARRATHTQQSNVVDYLSEDIRVGTRLEHRFFIDGSTGISKKRMYRKRTFWKCFPSKNYKAFFSILKHRYKNLYDEIKKF